MLGKRGLGRRGKPMGLYDNGKSSVLCSSLRSFQGSIHAVTRVISYVVGVQSQLPPNSESASFGAEDIQGEHALPIFPCMCLAPLNSGSS